MVSSEAPFHGMPSTPPESQVVPELIVSEKVHANGYFRNHLNYNGTHPINIPGRTPDIVPKDVVHDSHSLYHHYAPHPNRKIDCLFPPPNTEVPSQLPYTPPTPRASLALLVEASIAAAAAEREAEREGKHQPPHTNTQIIESQNIKTHSGADAYPPSGFSIHNGSGSGSDVLKGTGSAEDSPNLLKAHPTHQSLERVTKNHYKAKPKEKVKLEFSKERYDFHSQPTAEIDKYITNVIQRVHSQSTQRKDEMKPIDRRSKSLPQGWTRVGEILMNDHMRWECGRLIRGTQGCGRDCNSRFKDLTEFSSHIDLVHDQNFRPFLCPDMRCPWSIVGFHERSECTRHIRTKHYQPMYTCDFPSCYRTYNRSDAFRRHVRQSHRNDLVNQLAANTTTSQTSSVCDDSAATDEEDS